MAMSLGVLENKVVELHDGTKMVCTGGNGCYPDSLGTKVFGYNAAQGPGASIQVRRSDVKRIIGPAPERPVKTTKEIPLEQKAEFEHGAVVEQVNPGQLPDIDVTLWSDMERFKSGSIHMGYQLATYGNGEEGGSITAGGNEITVSVNGRLWGINLGVLVELAKAADKQREEKLTK